MQVARRLLPPGSRVVTGTSGGPDSQVLLDLLCMARQELSLEIWACGIDHGLRAEAGEELDLARALAQSHGIPFERIRISVEKQGNLLANARRGRYRALSEFLLRVGADRIAVAHTATDQVESILLNITRGCSLRGAGGIPWQRGHIVRPLLGVSRTDILTHAQDRHLAFASDPSNRDPKRARTKLRSQVLDVLRQLNPQFEESFGRFAALARRDDLFLNELATEELRCRKGPLGSINMAGLSEKPAPVVSRLLRQWLESKGLKASPKALGKLESALCQPGFAVSTGGTQIISERGYLWTGTYAGYHHKLNVPGEVRVQALDLLIAAKVVTTDGPLTAPDVGPLFQQDTSVAFDMDRLHLGIEVRSKRAGDQIRPYGLKGHTKVGDLFTDLKIPKSLRAVWPLVTCGEDVLWVTGLRRGDSAPITKDTRRVLTLHVLGEIPWRTC